MSRSKSDALDQHMLRRRLEGLPKTQQANWRFGSTLTANPSEMTYDRGPIGSIGTKLPRGATPPSLLQYTRGNKGRTEAGYNPPTTATMMQAAPSARATNDGPRRYSDGDRLRHSPAVIAFGSSDAGRKKGGETRSSKDARMMARAAALPPDILPTRHPASRWDVGNCSEYEALAQLLSSISIKDVRKICSLTVPHGKPDRQYPLCRQCKQLVLNMVNKYPNLEIKDAADGTVYSRRRSVAEMRYRT